LRKVGEVISGGLRSILLQQGRGVNTALTFFTKKFVRVSWTGVRKGALLYTARKGGREQYCRLSEGGKTLGGGRLLGNRSQGGSGSGQGEDGNPIRGEECTGFQKGKGPFRSGNLLVSRGDSEGHLLVRGSEETGRKFFKAGRLRFPRS